MKRTITKNLRVTLDEERVYGALAARLGAPLSVVARALLADAAERMALPRSAQTPEGRRIIRDIDNTGRKA